MHVRVTTLHMDPSRLDEAVRQVREDELPGWKQIPGFQGFMLMVDRASGKAVGTSYWESAEALAASEDTVKSSRQRAADAGGATAAPEVDRYEVAFNSWAG